MHKLMAGASLLPFLLFSTAASAAVSVNADDEMSAVRTTVPVQHGWMFSSDENAVLDAQVECPDGVRTDFEAVLIRDLSLMSGKNDTVIRLSASIARDTTLTLNFGKLEPGFYEVDITGAKPFNIGCDPEKIVSKKTAKPDFDQFWAANLAELKSVPLEYEMELIPERSTAARNVYRVTINSTDGAVMGGIYAEPVNPGKYPAYIEYMGYGADVYPYGGDDRPDAIQFLVSVREQGIFRTCGPGENGRWIDKGLGDKDTFYYKGAFCDAVRAVDFIASREKTDTTRIFGLGESQGGALTWIAASLDHRFRAITTAVPFLSDYQDYAKIVWWPVWEVFETADKEGITREGLFDMLSYFDVMNFTERITCPVRMAFGLQDPTCPPHTNFAGYNNVRTEKHYRCVPLCGHGMWQIQEWSEERDAWFKAFQSEL